MSNINAMMDRLGPVSKRGSDDEARCAAWATVRLGRSMGLPDTLTRELLDMLGLLDTAPRPAPRNASFTGHGTWAAYMRHYRNGDKACGPCARAATEHRAASRAEKVRVHIQSRNNR